MSLALVWSHVEGRSCLAEAPHRRRENPRHELLWSPGSLIPFNCGCYAVGFAGCSCVLHFYILSVLCYLWDCRLCSSCCFLQVSVDVSFMDNTATCSCVCVAHFTSWDTWCLQHRESFCLPWPLEQAAFGEKSIS